MSNLTIADVARLAGVSVSTVSRILNNKPDVSERTRQLVWQIIDEIGFSPDLQAQRLRSNIAITQTITLHYPIERSVFDPVQNALVMLDFILGVSAAVEEESLYFNLVTMPIQPNRLLELFRSGHVHGMILMQVHDYDERIMHLKNTSYPFVLIGRCLDNTGLNFVDLDYQQAVVHALQHLIQLGHRKIGYIDFPQLLLDRAYGPAKCAASGYEDVLRDCEVEIVRHQTEMDAESTATSVSHLLHDHPEITAIATVHGDSLTAVIETLKQNNYRIPDDISVIAICNQKQAQTTTPTVTRFDLPSEKQGYLAAKILMNKIITPAAPPEQKLMIPHFVQGSSTRHI